MLMTFRETSLIKIVMLYSNYKLRFRIYMHSSVATLDLEGNILFKMKSLLFYAATLITLAVNTTVS